MKKNQNGVTLIALAVTIIVMLILAGATMSVLSGDSGIMTNAKKSSVASEEAGIIEKMGQAFNTLKTQIEMDEISGESKTITEYANAVQTEIGASETALLPTTPAAEALSKAATYTDGKISIYTTGNLSTGKIVMVYKSSKFNVDADGTATPAKQKYKIMVGTITFDANGVSYSAPAKQVTSK